MSILLISKPQHSLSVNKHLLLITYIMSLAVSQLNLERKYEIYTQISI